MKANFTFGNVLTNVFGGLFSKTQTRSSMEYKIRIKSVKMIDRKKPKIGSKDPNNPLFTNNIQTNDFSGFLAKPKAKSNLPGIIMIHEWWGLNDYIRGMAKILADEGYAVIAVDLFEGEVAKDPKRAMELVSNVLGNLESAALKLKSAVKYLRGIENSPKIGSLGWCFGGGHSLNLGLNERLDATAIYYGRLVVDKEELKKITWPILGFFGDKDETISLEKIQEFKASLDELGIQNEIHIYPGLGHAFANPSNPRHAKKETEDAWNKTLRFFEDNLKRKK